MSIHLLGINHTTAPLDVRERLAFNADELIAQNHTLAQVEGVDEAVILSTCNRTELIWSTNQLDNPSNTIKPWLHHNRQLAAPLANNHFYQHNGAAAAQHLFHVASGLDSMILGEPQILGQLKSAFSAAQDANSTGPLLSRLFQHAIKTAKRVRTETDIGAHPVSVAFAAVNLAKNIFANFDQHHALLIGAGETNQLVATHLCELGLGKLTIANRSLNNATALARQFNGHAITLEQLPEHLASADIIISATGNPGVIIEHTQMQRAIKQRKHRPVFMVDLAVPRDFDSNIANLEDVYLYTVDDLHHLVQANLNARQDAAHASRAIIDHEVNSFNDWLNSRDATATIRQLRDHANHISQTALDKAQRALAAGNAPANVLEQLTHQLTNQWLHAPTARLRHAAEQQQHDILNAAQVLFAPTNTNPNS